MVLPTPPSMYRRSPIVTGGHAPGTAQLAATASTSSTPDARSKVDQLAAADVDRGDPQLPVRPVMRRQPLGDHVAADRLGHGGRGAGDRPDALQLLRHRGAGVGQRLQEQPGDVVDVDIRVDLLRLAGDLTVVQRVEPQAAAELGGDRRACRRPEQDVGIQQSAHRFRRLVFDAPQNAGFPGDSRQAPAGQHQSTLRCHRQSVPGWR